MRGGGVCVCPGSSWSEIVFSCICDWLRWTGFFFPCGVTVYPQICMKLEMHLTAELLSSSHPGREVQGPYMWQIDSIHRFISKSCLGLGVWVSLNSNPLWENIFNMLVFIASLVFLPMLMYIQGKSVFCDSDSLMCFFSALVHQRSAGERFYFFWKKEKNMTMHIFPSVLIFCLHL